MSTPPLRGSRPARQLVIVSGAGRSGTSTLAGSLSRLGYHVPQPEVKPNRSNPRGFYESRWVVDFHVTMLRAADATALDTRPQVQEKLRRVSDRQRFRDELGSWLERQFKVGSLVIKDPRTFWFLELWEKTAASLDAEITCLTMLRHPAEVVGSRNEYYTKNQTAEARAAEQIANLAGWVNCSLINERMTREHRRCLLQYTELLQDWRAALGRAATTLDLPFEDEISRRPHPIDKFIDSGLRRVRETWDDLIVPEWLQDVAEDSWQLLTGQRGDLDDTHVRAALGEAAQRYERNFAGALALSRDHTRAAVRRARRQTKRKVTKELSEPTAHTAGSERRDPTRTSEALPERETNASTWLSRMRGATRSARILGSSKR